MIHEHVENQKWAGKALGTDVAPAVAGRKELQDVGIQEQLLQQKGQQEQKQLRRLQGGEFGVGTLEKGRINRATICEHVKEEVNDRVIFLSDAGPTSLLSGGEFVNKVHLMNLAAAPFSRTSGSLFMPSTSCKSAKKKSVATPTHEISASKCEGKVLMSWTSRVRKTATLAGPETGHIAAAKAESSIVGEPAEVQAHEAQAPRCTSKKLWRNQAAVKKCIDAPLKHIELTKARPFVRAAGAATSAGANFTGSSKMPNYSRDLSYQGVPLRRHKNEPSGATKKCELLNNSVALTSRLPREAQLSSIHVQSSLRSQDSNSESCKKSKRLDSNSRRGNQVRDSSCSQRNSINSSSTRRDSSSDRKQSSNFVSDEVAEEQGEEGREGGIFEASSFRLEKMLFPTFEEIEEATAAAAKRDLSGETGNSSFRTVGVAGSADVCIKRQSPAESVDSSAVAGFYHTRRDICVAVDEPQDVLYSKRGRQLQNCWQGYAFQQQEDKKRITPEKKKVHSKSVVAAAALAGLSSRILVQDTACHNGCTPTGFHVAPGAAITQPPGQQLHRLPPQTLQKSVKQCSLQKEERLVSFKRNEHGEPSTAITCEYPSGDTAPEAASTTAVPGPNATATTTLSSGDSSGGNATPQLSIPLSSTILADRRSVFYKTQLCPHAVRGRCRLDKNCNFAHSKYELRPPPRLDKTKICAKIKAGTDCPDGHRCLFAHSREELRHSVAFYKTNMCRSWVAGGCLHPYSCNHAHGMRELLFFRTLAAVAGCRDFAREKEGVAISGASDFPCKAASVASALQHYRRLFANDPAAVSAAAGLAKASAAVASNAAVLDNTNSKANHNNKNYAGFCRAKPDTICLSSRGATEASAPTADNAAGSDTSTDIFSNSGRSGNYSSNNSFVHSDSNSSSLTSFSSSSHISSSSNDAFKKCSSSSVRTETNKQVMIDLLAMIPALPPGDREFAELLLASIDSRSSDSGRAITGAERHSHNYPATPGEIIRDMKRHQQTGLYAGNETPRDQQNPSQHQHQQTYSREYSSYRFSSPHQRQLQQQQRPPDNYEKTEEERTEQQRVELQAEARLQEDAEDDHGRRANEDAQQQESVQNLQERQHDQEQQGRRQQQQQRRELQKLQKLREFLKTIWEKDDAIGETTLSSKREPLPLSAPETTAQGVDHRQEHQELFFLKGIRSCATAATTQNGNDTGSDEALLNFLGTQVNFQLQQQQEHWERVSPLHFSEQLSSEAGTETPLQIPPVAAEGTTAVHQITESLTKGSSRPSKNSLPFSLSPAGPEEALRFEQKNTLSQLPNSCTHELFAYTNGGAFGKISTWLKKQQQQATVNPLLQPRQQQHFDTREAVCGCRELRGSVGGPCRQEQQSKDEHQQTREQQEALQRVQQIYSAEAQTQADAEENICGSSNGSSDNSKFAPLVVETALQREVSEVQFGQHRQGIVEPGLQHTKAELLAERPAETTGYTCAHGDSSCITTLTQPPIWLPPPATIQQLLCKQQQNHQQQLHQGQPHHSMPEEAGLDVDHFWLTRLPMEENRRHEVWSRIDFSTKSSNSCFDAAGGSATEATTHTSLVAPTDGETAAKVVKKGVYEDKYSSTDADRILANFAENILHPHQRSRPRATDQQPSLGEMSAGMLQQQWQKKPAKAKQVAILDSSQVLPSVLEGNKQQFLYNAVERVKGEQQGLQEHAKNSGVEDNKKSDRFDSTSVACGDASAFRCSGTVDKMLLLKQLVQHHPSQHVSGSGSYTAGTSRAAATTPTELLLLGAPREILNAKNSSWADRLQQRQGRRIVGEQHLRGGHRSCCRSKCVNEAGSNQRSVSSTEREAPRLQDTWSAHVDDTAAATRKKDASVAALVEKGCTMIATADFAPAGRLRDQKDGMKVCQNTELTAPSENRGVTISWGTSLRKKPAARAHSPQFLSVFPAAAVRPEAAAGRAPDLQRKISTEMEEAVRATGVSPAISYSASTAAASDDLTDSHYVVLPTTVQDRVAHERKSRQMKTVPITAGGQELSSFTVSDDTESINQDKKQLVALPKPLMRRSLSGLSEGRSCETNSVAEVALEK